MSKVKKRGSLALLGDLFEVQRKRSLNDELLAGHLGVSVDVVRLWRRHLEDRFPVQLQRRSVQSIEGFIQDTP